MIIANIASGRTTTTINIAKIKAGMAARAFAARFILSGFELEDGDRRRRNELGAGAEGSGGGGGTLAMALQTPSTENPTIPVGETNAIPKSDTAVAASIRHQGQD